MAKSCKECSNEALDKYADLYLKYERLEGQNRILEECFDIMKNLFDNYRKENEELKTKIRIYES